jgi:hypothetical protein
MKNEWAIRDVVPLSPIAHNIIHWHIFWKTPLRSLVNFLLRVLTIGWLFGGVGWILTLVFFIWIMLSF